MKGIREIWTKLHKAGGKRASNVIGVIFLDSSENIVVRVITKIFGARNLM